MELSRRTMLKSSSLALMSVATSTGLAAHAAIAEEPVWSIAPGVYIGEGSGRSGILTAQITVKNDCILDIEVLENPDTDNISEIAINSVTKDMRNYQSINVDTVTGATLTSFGLITAVQDALEKSGGDISIFEAEPQYPSPEAQDCECDIVIVGGGAAGMNAAIEAKAAGKSVILVEKQGFLGGGDSMFSSTAFITGGGYNVYKGEFEACTEEDYYNYICKKYEKYDIDKENIHACCMWGGKILDFYLSIGIPLTKFNGNKDFRNRMDDGSAPGTHIMRHLSAYMNKIGLDYRVNTKMTSIIMEDGHAAGVMVENPSGEYAIKAKAVILASGSFTRNEEIISDYCHAQKYAKLPRICSSANTGDGLLAAVEVGANLCNMSENFIKLNAIGFQADNGAALSMVPIQTTAALVNDDGLRYVNEYDTLAKVLIDTELEQPNQASWAIFDQKLVDANAFVRDCIALGYVQTGTTWEELASVIGMEGQAQENLVATMQKWQKTGTGNVEEDFGATIPDAFDTPPYYAIRVQPVMQGAYCGIETDDMAHVINTEGQVIPNLFAAGVVSGHGFPPTAGLTVASGFGRIAGQTAALEIA
ncbi:MAG: FAD-binding protein [Coriobacteriales bacterium]|nr:FAD-binding protein [Coriobacteriales bacterium]